MELNYFKDMIFEILNETDVLNILDIETDDKNNLFTVSLIDGSIFEIFCREKPAALD